MTIFSKNLGVWPFWPPWLRLWRRITMAVTNHCGGADASTFFNTVHLLPKDFRLEKGAPGLFLTPGTI